MAIYVIRLESIGLEIISFARSAFSLKLIRNSRA